MFFIFNFKEIFCVYTTQYSSELSELSSKLTGFGASKTLNGFQINDMQVFITLTDNSSFIYQHPIYMVFEFDRSEKKMRWNGISFFQTVEVVDVQLRRTTGYDDVIGVGANLRRHRRRFHAYVS